MNLSSALRAHLLTFPALAALVGTRVYPRRLPQKVTLPAITYLRVSTTVVQHKEDSRLDAVRVQIDGWADDYAGAEALRAALRSAMASFKRASSPRVTKAFLRDDRDLEEYDISRWRASMDFTVWVVEN